MPCTTVLVGKNASNDRSTMIARTDDGHFDVKKLILVKPEDQPHTYTCVGSHLTLTLPDSPMRYTACPNVEPSEGIWAATGINECNVGMTATETLSTNPRVLAADPYVEYQKGKGENGADIPGGIGEEDFVVLVLPYIHSAREGVLRLGALLEQYGTYEANGIAFNDENEIWWLDTIGGHHWIATRVRDDTVVINPNQFCTDTFDLEDALGAQREHLCSADLRTFISENRLDLNTDGTVNPRNIFGSHSYHDHIYNTPRAWYMGRFLTPFSHKWDGENAEYTPESDNIPWALVPDRKITVEDVKFMLSSHYQGTPYDPYTAQESTKRGMYRSIGINRTGVTSICQIRPEVPEPIKAVEWIFFCSPAFDAALPLYTNVTKMPAYVSAVATDASTENFYWASRLLGALADPIYPLAIQGIEGYQETVMTRGRQIIRAYDKKMTETGDFTLTEEANEALCAMAKEETQRILNTVLRQASEHMKNGYNRADN